MSDVSQPIEQGLVEIKSKSEFGRVVHVQANTVHDLMADIRFLLDRLQQTREELEVNESEYQSVVSRYGTMAREFHKQKAKLEQVKAELSAKDKVLEWYADTENWDEQDRGILVIPARVDSGKQARSILFQYGGTP